MRACVGARLYPLSISHLASTPVDIVWPGEFPRGECAELAAAAEVPHAHDALRAHLRERRRRRRQGACKRHGRLGAVCARALLRRTPPRAQTQRVHWKSRRSTKEGMLRRCARIVQARTGKRVRLRADA
eukprot:5295124-Pleurochrysis_carterae.AAC.11